MILRPLNILQYFLQEIKCLQDNYEKLTAKCKSSIGEFTEEESEVRHNIFGTECIIVKNVLCCIEMRTPFLKVCSLSLLLGC